MTPAPEIQEERSSQAPFRGGSAGGVQAGRGGVQEEEKLCEGRIRWRAGPGWG